MKDQFFGKAFWITIAALAVSFVLAYVSIHTPTEAVLTGFIGLAVLFLASWKLEIGLYIAFAELIATSHGHLFSAGPVSIRMAIFGGVMIAWLTHLLRGKKIDLRDIRLYPYYFLFASIILGLLVGWNANTHANVLNDGNGYLYALYILPMLTIPWDAIKRRILLQVFTGATTFVSLLTLAILYLFTHMNEPIQRALYTFFRDARIAELTRVVGDIFRVFLQAQFFSVVLLLILVSTSFWFWKNRRDQNVIACGITLSLSTLIISLSRSFWIGLIVGGIALAVCTHIIRRPSIKEVLIKKAAGLLMLVAAVSVLWIVLAFPFPRPANVSGFGDLLSDRTLNASDAAISSRWNLLPEMNNAIAASPIIGSGFGKIIAFESDDPRVREIYPDGKWRTYSFEWGWLDAWLKMGLFGPIALVWLGIASGAGLIRGFRKEHGWLSIGLFGGLIALYATHTFSPYLNHPIGIGYLIFLIPFLVPAIRKTPEGVMISIKDVIKDKMSQAVLPVPQRPSVTSSELVGSLKKSHFGRFVRQKPRLINP